MEVVQERLDVGVLYLLVFAIMRCFLEEETDYAVCFFQEFIDVFRFAGWCLWDIGVCSEFFALLAQ